MSILEGIIVKVKAEVQRLDKDLTSQVTAYNTCSLVSIELRILHKNIVAGPGLR